MTTTDIGVIEMNDNEHPIWDCETIDGVIYYWLELEANFQPEESNQALRIFRAIQQQNLIKVRCGCKGGKVGYLWNVRGGCVQVVFDDGAGEYNADPKLAELVSVERI